MSFFKIPQSEKSTGSVIVQIVYLNVFRCQQQSQPLLYSFQSGMPERTEKAKAENSWFKIQMKQQSCKESKIRSLFSNRHWWTDVQPPSGKHGYSMPDGYSERGKLLSTSFLEFLLLSTMSCCK